MDRVFWGLVLGLVCACASKDVQERRIVFDFEADEAPWLVAYGDLSPTPSQRQIRIRRHGELFLDSSEGGVEKNGVLISPVFTIDLPYLVFRAGGSGDGKSCWLELRDAKSNKRVRKIPTAPVWAMETHIVDVAGLAGRKVRMQLIDRDDCTLRLDWVRLVDG